MSYNRRLIRLVYSRAPVDDSRERSDLLSDDRRAMIIPVHSSYTAITTIHHNRMMTSGKIFGGDGQILAGEVNEVVRHDLLWRCL
jgi:hypothetical protein